MPVKVPCPNCKSSMLIPDTHLGKKVRCPRCQSVTAAPPPPKPEEFAELVEPDEELNREITPPPKKKIHPKYEQDLDHLEPIEEEVRGSRKKLGGDPSTIPSNVQTSIAAVCVMMLIEVIITLLVLSSDEVRQEKRLEALIEMFVGLLFSGLILWGLHVGHRLAWQWGRILGMLGAILCLIAGSLLLHTSTKPAVPMVIVAMGGGMLAISACLFTVTFSLGTVTAKEYFGLRCPSCERLSGNAGDFFFNTAKCNRCKITW